VNILARKHGFDCIFSKDRLTKRFLDRKLAECSNRARSTGIFYPLHAVHFGSESAFQGTIGAVRLSGHPAATPET